MSSEQQERCTATPKGAETNWHTHVLGDGAWASDYRQVAPHAPLTDVQQDAGGRWEVKPWTDNPRAAWLEVEEGYQHGLSADLAKILASRHNAALEGLESRLSEEQQARQRAEKERDARPTESEYNALMEQRDNFKAAMNAADQDYVREHERAQIAEAENTRLRAQVEGLAVRAALADEIAEHIRTRDGNPSMPTTNVGLDLNLMWWFDWLTRHDALPATQQPAAPTQEGEEKKQRCLSVPVASPAHGQTRTMRNTAGAHAMAQSSSGQIE